MGLTRKSVGKNTICSIDDLDNKRKNRRIVAFAGNPNVGKSTLFNAITGMNQHTGNWPGKTVMSAVGKCTYHNDEYVFVDLPGCYSLKARSPEEEVARDFIHSKKADVTVVVCDATSLERNLTLVLQIKEITDNIIVCVNLMDEAKKKNIYVDIERLEKLLSSPVIGTTAHDKKSIGLLLEAIEKRCKTTVDDAFAPLTVYPQYIEDAIKYIVDKRIVNNRYEALQFLEENYSPSLFGENIAPSTYNIYADDVVNTLCRTATYIAEKVTETKKKYTDSIDYKIDKILTSRTFGFLSMFVLLLVLFWITITGANYLSDILSSLFSFLEAKIYLFLEHIKIPQTILNITVYGIYRVMTWIIAVMLPPMAIFFPLFTFLEDVGFLPRIAFNLDRCFKKCSACGKQALTMCMGFGCNAAGVVGCRIIDSKRERLIAILTNAFVPCNGRFPAIISIITMFFIADAGGLLTTFLSSLYLTLFILAGVCISLFASKILSKTLLKGFPSSFILELPSYRKPQIKKIIIRSIFDRTLFVLGRAVSIAAPAGLVIWLFANVNIGNSSIILHISDFLDPLGKLMGLDGVILTAFIFGFPANEIIIPLIMMIYASNGVLSDLGSLQELKNLFIANGWTFVTALNTAIFMLMHWPCSTTCLTIKAETKSWKWTAISFLLPTICGVALCIIINLISKML